MMASAVYSEDDMQLVLMLWGIPWERMTLGEANRLTIVGYLIQNAVVRANRYLEALRNRRYVEGTNILDESAFTHLAKAFFDSDRGPALRGRGARTGRQHQTDGLYGRPGRQPAVRAVIQYQPGECRRNCGAL